MVKKKYLSLFLVWVLLFMTVLPAAWAQSKEPSGEASDPMKERMGEEFRAAHPQGISAMASSGNRMFNDFIEYAVETTGRFTVGTTGGNPENPYDDNQNMLYGHPAPWSSFTTIRVNDSVYTYTPNIQFPTPNEADHSNSSEQDLADQNIKVQQMLRIVPSTSTEREDSVEIKYLVKNEDTNPHDVGIRIMMDTMLGANDHAPFQIPGVGPVTTEREFSGDQIPEYWQAFDSLSQPRVIAQGHLTKTGENKPDKVQFTNWSNVYNTLWDYAIHPGASNGDSAVSIYWNPKSLAPGETREYVTYYGLSELVQDMRPPVTLSITGPQNIQVNSAGNYAPNPATVTAYFQNIGNAPAENIVLNLLLPAQMKLVQEQNASINMGTLQAGELKQASWQVEFLPLTQAATLQYRVQLSASNTDSKDLALQVKVPPLHKINKKRSVILLPGMVGTELGFGMDDYWTPQIGEIDEDIHHLRLNANGESVEDIFHGGPIEDFYGKIEEKLEQHDSDGDGHPDLDVHVLGYDWRMDNDMNAKALETYINALKLDDVTIIAHSMGGIVASKYIANGNQDKVDKLITIGTPYLGAPKALNVFETGNLIGGIADLLMANALKNLAPNMSSAYQLLPNQHYFSINNTYYVQKITDRGWFSSPKVQKLNSFEETTNFIGERSWANQYLLNNSLRFQDELNIPDTVNSVDSYVIVGYGSGTNGLIKERYKKNGSFDSADVDPINGDGTVPLLSATLGGRVEIDRGTFWDDYYYYPNHNPDKTYFVKNVEHSDLQRNDKVISQVLRILDGNPARVSGIEGRAKFNKWLKVRVESPVNLHLYDQQGNHVGLINESQYEEKIPSSSYQESGHTKTILLENGVYNVRLNGTDDGQATLILQQYSELNELIKTIRFDHVEVTPQTIITTTTDMDQPLKLVIDKNGDGNTVSMDPTAVLDGPGSQDETAPEVGFDIEGQKSAYDWYKSDVKVSVHAQDPESGVSRIEYRVNEGEVKPYEAPLTFTDEGTVILDAVAYNNNRIQSDGISTSIPIDKTVPEFNIHFDPASQTFKIKALDSLSGPVTEEFTVTPFQSNALKLESYMQELEKADPKGKLPTLDLPEGGKQTIVIKDKADNTLELSLVSLANGKTAVLSLQGLKYNGVEVTIPDTRLAATYQDTNGKGVHLHQMFIVKDKWKLVANYNQAQDETMIVTKQADTGAVQEKKQGMILLNLESNKGNLSYKE